MNREDLMAVLLDNELKKKFSFPRLVREKGDGNSE